MTPERNANEKRASQKRIGGGPLKCGRKGAAGDRSHGIACRRSEVKALEGGENPDNLRVKSKVNKKSSGKWHPGLLVRELALIGRQSPIS